ncbi:MAG: YdbH domain-containing protein [Woeseiaceae bacterium]
MKLLKFLAVFLLIAVIAIVLVNYHRESIVRELANSALRDFGLTASELSIDALGTDRVRLSRLVLLLDDGGRIDIEDLSVPLGFAATSRKAVSAREVVFAPRANAIDEAAPRFASALQAVLDLPSRLPNTEVSVARLRIGGYPAVSDLNWRTGALRQSFAATLGRARVQIADFGDEDGVHRAQISLDDESATRIMTLPLTLRRADGACALRGDLAVQLAPLRPVLVEAGVLPDALRDVRGELAGAFALDLGDGGDKPLVLQLELQASGEVAAAYALDDATTLGVTARIAAPLRVDLSYPDLDWTAGLASGEVRVRAGRHEEAALAFGDLVCRKGLRCDVRASAEAGPVALEAFRADRVTASATLSVAAAEALRLSLSGDPRIEVGGVSTGDYTAESIRVTALMDAEMVIDESGWRAGAGSFGLRIDSLAYGDVLTATLPLHVQSLRVEDGAGSVDARLSLAAGGATLAWEGIGLVMPGVTGTVAVRQNDVTAGLDIGAARGGLTAHADLSLQLDTGTGRLAVRDAMLHFDRRKLSDWFADWPHAWDIVSGSWSAALDLTSSGTGAGAAWSGGISQRVDGLAGHYGDIAFAGLSTSIDAQLDAASGIRVAPAHLTVELVDVGVPVEGIVAGYTLNLTEQAVDVRDLGMSLLGGTVLADPFRYSLQAAANDILLRAKSIQLQFIVDLAEFDDIKLNGSISGVLPVTMGESAITVTGGRLESDPPGGVIRYGSGEQVSDGNQGIDLVSRALRNFQFDSLTSDVDYTENGDLKLKMRLTGINPDMDPLQPVILNLGIENNIPQLLRSLQATRAIEDILQRESDN